MRPQIKPQREQLFVSQMSCALGWREVAGWGKVPFNHLVNPRQSHCTLSWKLHSSQFDLARSRRRLAGQAGSDMKHSVIVISPLEGGLECEPVGVLAFEMAGAAPVGAEGCWG